jgi:hypothetical protein
MVAIVGLMLLTGIARADIPGPDDGGGCKCSSQAPFGGGIPLLIAAAAVATLARKRV